MYKVCQTFIIYLRTGVPIRINLARNIIIGLNVIIVTVTVGHTTYMRVNNNAPIMFSRGMIIFLSQLLSIVNNGRKYFGL